MRAKSHGAMLDILADRQAELALWCRQTLASGLAGRRRKPSVLTAWDESQGPSTRG